MRYRAATSPAKATVTGRVAFLLATPVRKPEAFYAVEALTSWENEGGAGDFSCFDLQASTKKSVPADS